MPCQARMEGERTDAQAQQRAHLSGGRGAQSTKLMAKSVSWLVGGRLRSCGRYTRTMMSAVVPAGPRASVMSTVKRRNVPTVLVVWD